METGQYESTEYSDEESLWEDDSSELVMNEIEDEFIDSLLEGADIEEDFENEYDEYIEEEMEYFDGKEKERAFVNEICDSKECNSDDGEASDHNVTDYGHGKMEHIDQEAETEEKIKNTTTNGSKSSNKESPGHFSHDLEPIDVKDGGVDHRPDEYISGGPSMVHKAAPRVKLRKSWLIENNGNNTEEQAPQAEDFETWKKARVLANQQTKRKFTKKKKQQQDTINQDTQNKVVGSKLKKVKKIIKKGNDNQLGQSQEPQLTKKKPILKKKPSTVKVSSVQETPIKKKKKKKKVNASAAIQERNVDEEVDNPITKKLKVKVVVKKKKKKKIVENVEETKETADLKTESEVGATYTGQEKEIHLLMDGVTDVEQKQQSNLQVDKDKSNSVSLARTIRQFELMELRSKVSRLERQIHMADVKRVSELADLEEETTNRMMLYRDKSMNNVDRISRASKEKERMFEEQSIQNQGLSATIRQSNQKLRNEFHKLQQGIVDLKQTNQKLQDRNRYHLRYYKSFNQSLTNEISIATGYYKHLSEGIPKYQKIVSEMEENVAKIEKMGRMENKIRNSHVECINIMMAKIQDRTGSCDPALLNSLRQAINETHIRYSNIDDPDSANNNESVGSANSHRSSNNSSIDTAPPMHKPKVINTTTAPISSEKRRHNYNHATRDTSMDTTPTSMYQPRITSSPVSPERRSLRLMNQSFSYESSPFHETSSPLSPERRTLRFSQQSPAYNESPFHEPSVSRTSFSSSFMLPTDDGDTCSATTTASNSWSPGSDGSAFSMDSY